LIRVKPNLVTHLSPSFSLFDSQELLVALVNRLREEERWLVAESLTPTNIIDDVSVVEKSVVKCGLGCFDCSDWFWVGFFFDMFDCLF
jgi:hypothetical protein